LCSKYQRFLSISVKDLCLSVTQFHPSKKTETPDPFIFWIRVTWGWS